MAIALDVSFILVNYFSEAHTVRCVKSIVDKTLGVTYEIRLVDNHSGLNPAAILAECRDAVILMSDRNLGFGAGCNLGAKDARGNYLFFLNNDSQLQNDAAKILGLFLDQHPDAALAGAQLLSPAGQKIPSFDYFPTLTSKLIGISLLRALHPDRYPSKRIDRRDPCEVDLVAGACLFIRRSIFQSLKGFDPQFFLYCEEEDLAMRVRAGGSKAFFVPEAKIMHVGGGSSKASVPVLKKEFYISFFKFYRKHYGTLKTGALKTLCVGQVMWKYLFRRERDVWRPVLQWLLRGAPESESLRHAPGNIDGPAHPF